MHGQQNIKRNSVS